MDANSPASKQVKWFHLFPLLIHWATNLTQSASHKTFKKRKYAPSFFTLSPSGLERLIDASRDFSSPFHSVAVSSGSYGPLTFMEQLLKYRVVLLQSQWQ